MSPMRWFIPVIVLVCVISGATFSSVSGDQYWGQPVRYIRYECSASIPEQIILQAITIRENEPLSPESIRRTIKNLHLLNRFQSVEVYTEPFLDGCALIFVLESNWLIDDIRFEGGAVSILFSYGLTGGFSPKTLYRETGLKRQDVYSVQATDTAIAALKDFYYWNGYAQSSISLDTRFKPEDHTVDLVFTIDQGPQTEIQVIRFDGNSAFTNQQLMIAGDLFIGRRFSRDLVNRARERMMQYYMKRGYLSAQVFRPDIRYVAENNHIELFFRIKEEPAIDIDLKTDWHTWNLKWWFDLLEQRQNAFLEDLGIGGSGQITPRRMEEGRRNLERQFWNRGYLNATVELKTQTLDSGEIQYRFIVDEQDIVRVSNVFFFGNEAFTTDELLRSGVISTRPGSKYHHDTFSADGADLKRFYQSHGYQDVEVISGFTADEENDSISVVFNIQEGPMYRWNSIDVQNNRAMSREEILGILQIFENGPYDPQTLEDNIQKLLNAYLVQGYAEIAIDRDVQNIESIQPSLMLTIHEGTASTIRSVLITGYQKSLRQVIERNLPDLKGEPFYYQTMLNAERALARTNLFRSVDVSGLPGEAGIPDRTVLVRLREQPSIFIEGGPGYNTDRGFNGYLSFYTTNLGGANRYLGASGTLSEVDYKANVIYREPEFANLPVQLELRLLTEVSDEDGFQLRRRGGRATWSYRVREQLRLLLIYRFDDDEPYDIQPDTDLPEEYRNSIKIGSLSPGFLYDSRDDPRDPGKGSLFSVKVEFARPVYNSEVTFTKMTAEATHFFRISESTVLGAAFRFGLGDHLPYQEQFRLGGIKTIRGWDFEDIRGGTYSADNGIIGPSEGGGDIMLLGNLEYRYPLFWGLEGVVFVDSGNVYEDSSDISFSNLKTTAGLGVRFMTPVGPVGVDYGYNIMKDDNDPPDRWSFIIGHTF